MEAASFISPVSSPGLQVPCNSPANGFRYNERVQPHLLSRALEANLTMNNFYTNTNEFVRPEEPAADLRSGAGLPLHRPNRARNDSQSQMDRVNNALFQNQPRSYGRDPRSIARNAQGQQLDYGLQHDFDHQRSYSQQVDSRHHVNFRAQNDQNQDSTGASEPKFDFKIQI